ncbi:MAG: hypothetical protein J7513_08885 [Solirubrobacteraceae bacterium]|nr:hypothetical protein [Solirubrobacteraceae bacterium]
MSDQDPQSSRHSGLRVIDGGDRRRAPHDPLPPAAERRAEGPPASGPRVLDASGAPAPMLPISGQVWTEEQADAWLAARDLVGWRFALDRIERLLAELDAPHQSAPAIHVVGTNGKSSTTRMISALLSAHGHHPGAFLSPHLAHLRERIEVEGRPIDEGAHARAVTAVARAATRVDRPGDPVTQFEAHTASAFVALADAECDVLVIEAGLGGRLDATNVLGAPVVALTSVDLEHTALLGSTIEEITAEKVAVVTPGATLILGPGLHEAAAIVARDHAARVGAQVVSARAEGIDRELGPGYQQKNFATARAVVEAYLGALEPRAVREVAEHFAMPARFEQIATEPITILDGAHNPAGARALADALTEAGFGTGGVAVMSVLSDKDAAGMAHALSRHVDRFIVCDCASPRVMHPEQLAETINDALPGVTTSIVDDPASALATARITAGPDGFVVICGTLALAQALRPDRPAAHEPPAARSGPAPTAPPPWPPRGGAA